MACIDGACVAGACSRDDECPGGTTCQPWRSGSLESSTGEEGALAEVGCFAPVSHEEQCDTALDCGDGLLCSTLYEPPQCAGLEDDLCVDASDCGGGLICFAGGCQNSDHLSDAAAECEEVLCDGEDLCPEGFVCAGGLCVRGCDGSCSQGTCSGGASEPGWCIESECPQGDECPVDQVCQEDACLVGCGPESTCSDGTSCLTLDDADGGELGSFCDVPNSDLCAPSLGAFERCEVCPEQCGDGLTCAATADTSVASPEASEDAIVLTYSVESSRAAPGTADVVLRMPEEVVTGARMRLYLQTREGPLHLTYADADYVVETPLQRRIFIEGMDSTDQLQILADWLSPNLMAGEIADGAFVSGIFLANDPGIEFTNDWSMRDESLSGWQQTESGIAVEVDGTLSLPAYFVAASQDDPPQDIWYKVSAISADPAGTNRLDFTLVGQSPSHGEQFLGVTAAFVGDVRLLLNDSAGEVLIVDLSRVSPPDLPYGLDVAGGPAAELLWVAFGEIDAGPGDDVVDLAGDCTGTECVLVGGEGNDYLHGAARTLEGGAGEDTLDLPLWLQDAPARMDGGEGNDVLFFPPNTGRGVEPVRRDVIIVGGDGVDQGPVLSCPAPSDVESWLLDRDCDAETDLETCLYDAAGGAPIWIAYRDHEDVLAESAWQALQLRQAAVRDSVYRRLQWASARQNDPSRLRGDRIVGTSAYCVE